MSDTTPAAGSIRPALDFSLDEARRRLDAAAGRVLVVTDDAEALDEISGPFDAAWVSLGRLDTVDVSGLGRRLAVLLPAGAPVACVIPGCWPLPAVLERALRGVGELPWPVRNRLEGRPPRCLSAAAWRRAFGPAFSWHRARGVGVLVPVRWSGSQAGRRALVLGLLASAEHVMGGWPILRTLGERILLEGARR